MGTHRSLAFPVPEVEQERNAERGEAGQESRNEEGEWHQRVRVLMRRRSR